MSAGAAHEAGAPHEPVGSMAEEALRLVAALGERWAGVRGASVREAAETGAAHAAAGIDAAMAGIGHGPECTACPVCRGLALLRESHPEVLAHLTDAGTALLRAVRATVDAHEAQWSRRPATPVQKIRVQ